MKDGPEPSPQAAAAAERRRLDVIFGDVLPETTRDEHDREVDARTGGEDAGEAWLRSQVPPHHGD